MIIEIFKSKSEKTEKFDGMNWVGIVHYMDDEIAERLHGILSPCELEEFLISYIDSHEETFGEEFVIN